MKVYKIRQYCFIILTFVSLLVIAGCLYGTSTKSVREVIPENIQGYLPPDKVPDSLSLLPPPPAENSAAFAADQEAFTVTRPLSKTPRWSQAARDANLNFPAAPEAFSCALGAPITSEAMPNLYLLMRRTMSDAGLTTAAAKNNYKRVRPFVVNKQTSCTPDREKELSLNGSYPSGHTSIGWTWALILAEIAPERADAIFARGYAYGQSRVICGMHWQSDVTAGRVVAAAVVAKLHADAVFRVHLAAAREELAVVRAKGLKPSVDCRAEAAALAF